MKTLVIALITLVIASCGDSKPHVFNVWKSRGTPAYVMDLRSTSLQAKSAQLVFDTNAACVPDIHVSGKSNKGVLTIANSTWDNEGKDPDCASYNGDYTYEAKEKTLKICEGGVCADYDKVPGK